MHRSPSVPLFLYPDVQWAFPRMRDVVDDLARFRPDVVHVATEFSLGIAGREGGAAARLPLVASAHTDYDQYAARYGVDLGAPRRLALSPLVLRPGAQGALPVPHLRAAPAQPRRHCTPASGAGAWTRSGSIPGSGARSTGRASGSDPGDLLVTYIGRIAREKNLELLLHAWETLAPVRGTAQLVLVGRGPLEDEIRRREIAGRARARPAPGPRALGRLRLGRRVHLPVADRDVRQLAARGDGLGAAVAGGGRRAACSSSPSTAATPGWWRRTAPRPSRRAWSGCSPTPPCAGASPTGALETARERDWDQVYDRLVADYEEAVEEKANDAGGVSADDVSV